MDNKNAAVKMRNISKSFGTVKANDKIWLDIYRGEILALLGENGSGKTTLMNISQTRAKFSLTIRKLSSARRRTL